MDRRRVNVRRAIPLEKNDPSRDFPWAEIVIRQILRSAIGTTSSLDEHFLRKADSRSTAFE